MIESKRAWQALGKIHYGVTALKPSVTISAFIVCGERYAGGRGFLLPKICERFCFDAGLPTQYYDVSCKKAVGRAVQKGTAVGWDLLTPE
ncbi:MAG: hypothetical protein R3E08_04070 [Thiotrichaceae bacterium]